MSYQPVTDAGRQSQKALRNIIDEQVNSAADQMNQTVKTAVADFKDELSDLLAKASDDLDELKGRLEQIKSAGNQDTSSLVRLTEDCVIALNTREETLRRVGAIAVTAMKRAVGIPI